MENQEKKARDLIRKRISKLEITDSPEKNLVELTLRLVRYNGLHGASEMGSNPVKINQLAEIVGYSKRLRDSHPEVASVIGDYLGRYVEYEEKNTQNTLGTRNWISASYREAQKALVE